MMQFMKTKVKTFFSCRNCGYQTPKWLGKCPDCGEWESFVEEKADISKKGKSNTASRYSYSEIFESQSKTGGPIPINSKEYDEEERILSGVGEFDRVLGGGLVLGSLVLIGGDPGIGKSTLMLQALHGIAATRRKVLYVSGEESLSQLIMRSKRIEAASDGFLIATEIEVEKILEMVAKVRPDVLVIDSIQTMYSGELMSAPGSVSQVREAAMQMLMLSKNTGISTFIVGHVTKDGAIAGPRVMEHMVDTVLYFEGDKNNVFRILRSVKNRFGSTNEIGVFEMKENGLNEVPNPSGVFLSERPDNTSGSVVTCAMEGSRPILIELQALAAKSVYATPKRTSLGLDPNRVALLMAVMEKKLGIALFNYDIFMNVAGGVKVYEPGIDLAAIAAIGSSFLDKAIHGSTVVIGEVGLTGEVRSISQGDLRISEIQKMGFTRCIMPLSSIGRLNKKPRKMSLIGVRTVLEVMEALF